MPYIYKITNNINGKIYIGKTSNTIQERWHEHKSDYKKRVEEKRPLYSAMKKYGIENFSIEEIEFVATDAIASERETYWIELLGSFKYGYNATKGGDGKRYADYDLIYALFQEGKISKEIQKITGYDHATIALALEQQGIDKIQRHIRGVSRISKAVVMLDKNTQEILKTFSSVSEAERFLDKPRSRQHILEVCRGKRKTAYGYIWKFIE